jgi:hypothetical protein
MRFCRRYLENRLRVAALALALRRSMRCHLRVPRRNPDAHSITFSANHVRYHSKQQFYHASYRPVREKFNQAVGRPASGSWTLASAGRITRCQARRSVAFGCHSGPSRTKESDGRDRTCPALPAPPHACSSRCARRCRALLPHRRALLIRRLRWISTWPSGSRRLPLSHDGLQMCCHNFAEVVVQVR